MIDTVARPACPACGGGGALLYAAITDARIVYPWEIDRSGGLEGVANTSPETN